MLAAKDRLNATLALLALAAILGISAYLRYYNLPTNPGWDGDEGYNINIAWNLAQGRMQMFATTFAFVQHPPLFYMILVPIFRVLGPDILALRLVTSTFGLITTLVMYLTGKEFGHHKVGLFAAGIFAVYPVAVIHNRWGYSYNQLMFLAALCAYFTLKYVLARSEKRKTGWLLTAAFTAGLGAITDQEGLFLIAAVVVVALVLDRRKAVVAAPAAVLFPALYAMTMLIITPKDFLYDWQHNVSRISDASALATPLILGMNYQQFLAFDYWLPLGIVGIFIIPNRKARMTIVLFTALAMLTILKIRNPNPFFRTAIPLLPFICLGLASLSIRATEYLFQWGNDIWLECLGNRWQQLRPSSVMFTIFVLIYMPLSITLVFDVVNAQTGFHTKSDDLIVKAPHDAQLAAEFVNNRSSPDDLVITSSHISWMLTAHTADLLQAVAAQGTGTAFYPSNMPRSRFVYDAHFDKAKYLVLDDFSRLWVKEMPEERLIAQQVMDNWTSVFESGEYVVYRNPSFE